MTILRWLKLFVYVALRRGPLAAVRAVRCVIWWKRGQERRGR